MAPIEAGHTYKIVNVQGGTCIDLDSGSRQTIQGWGFHDGDNQKWVMEKWGDQWVFHSKTGLYLGLDHSHERRDGCPLIATGEAHKWDIWPDEENRGHYRIFEHGTTLNWDLSDNGNRCDGTRIQLWTKWNGQNQTWRFDPVDC